VEPLRVVLLPQVVALLLLAVQVLLVLLVLLVLVEACSVTWVVQLPTSLRTLVWASLRISFSRALLAFSTATLIGRWLSRRRLRK
jgi:ABC-type sulfate transport system permease component